MAKGFTNVPGTKKSEIDNINLLLDDIKALIGQTTHTDGTTTTGTMMAKLNKLLTDLTATRAGYIDKLSNFGATGDTGGTSTAGTLTAKVNKLLTDWTTTRADKIDTISTNASNLNTRLTSTRAGYLDKLSNFGATGDTGGTSSAGTLTAKVNKLLADWTTTRAGYLDTIKTYVTNLNTRLTDTRASKIDTIDTNTARLTSTRAGYIDKIGSSWTIKSIQWGYISHSGYIQQTQREFAISPVNANNSLLYADPSLTTHPVSKDLSNWGVRLYNDKIVQNSPDIHAFEDGFSYWFCGFRYFIIEFKYS